MTWYGAECGSGVPHGSPMAPPDPSFPWGDRADPNHKPSPQWDPIPLTTVGWGALLGAKPPRSPTESQPAEPSSWIHPHEPARPRQPPGTWMGREGKEEGQGVGLRSERGLWVLELRGQSDGTEGGVVVDLPPQPHQSLPCPTGHWDASTAPQPPGICGADGVGVIGGSGHGLRAGPG